MESTSDTRELIEGLRELWLTDSDLAFLQELSPANLRKLHAEATAHAARVHEGQRSLYEVMAKATRFIPNFMLERFSSGLSAYVRAQIATYLEPKAAASLAKAFDPASLAEIALHLDATRAASIAVHTDLETLIRITDSLARKGLMRKLGEMSDALDEKMLEKLIVRMDDPERVAAIAVHMNALPKLRYLATRLDKKMTQRVVRILEAQGPSAVVDALRYA